MNAPLIAHPAFAIAPQRRETRASIDALEDALRAKVSDGTVEQTIFDGETDEGNDQCQHYFGDGVYARSLWIPAGTCVVGKIHKQARICIIAAGKCKFTDEYRCEEVEAPWIGEFKPHTKTAVVAVTDTLWIAIVGTDIKDPQQVVKELTAPSWSVYSEQIAGGTEPWLLETSAEQ